MDHSIDSSKLDSLGTDLKTVVSGVENFCEEANRIVSYSFCAVLTSLCLLILYVLRAVRNELIEKTEAIYKALGIQRLPESEQPLVPLALSVSPIQSRVAQSSLPPLKMDTVQP